MPEPEKLVLQLLCDMRGDIERMDGKIERMDVKIDDARSELRSEMQSLRADVAADLLATRKDLGEQIVGVRRAVVEYHSAVIGHGVLISDLEARVRRIEQHLDLPPVEQH